MSPVLTVSMPSVRYSVKLRESLQSPRFSSLYAALQWVHRSYPGAFYDLENLNGRDVLAIFWCPDNKGHIRLGSVGSLF